MPTSISTLAASFLSLCPRGGDRIQKDMATDMFGTSQGNKICEVVIRPVAIDMMNTLSGKKRAPMCLFPDKAMLKDIPLYICSGMLRRIDIPVAPMLITATLPLWMVWAFLARHVMTMYEVALLGMAISGLAIRIADRYGGSTTASTKEVRLNAITRHTLIPMGLSCLSEMVRKEAGRMILVMGLRLDGLAASTFAELHGIPPDLIIVG